ncbi:hypothetical protein [Modestobacter sp. VKM Ac-2984]|uniref:hypothetical protein n=1 Tax=Modestobacter sp. VKM Ac-2984 TaxID=3004138 RepID=UPI0022AB313E|nr:hypothetical protein [Modestobacter sp. VKM Ac-2984]MCZ2816774.1 hypothetical protein [Modestobacter sp. VKM Ac-2984]
MGWPWQKRRPAPSYQPLLREGLGHLLADYVCEVKESPDHVAVRGEAAQCPFGIDLVENLAILDAGAEAEFVSEWLLRGPEDVTDLLRLIERVLGGQAITKKEKLGLGELKSHQPYSRITGAS